MFPLFEPINWFLMYTFWLTMAMCFFLFLWMLKKTSVKFWFDYVIFQKNMLWFFLWVFFFSSLFYVIWKWHNLKYIKNPLEFFVMSDYNFSLAWAFVWFFVVLFTLLKISKEKLDKFIDWIVMSLFFMFSVGYIWALLGWQVYWVETLLGIEISYTHPFTPVPFQIPIFPLPVVYSILFFMLFSLSYMSSMYMHMKWMIWYVWLILMSTLFMMFEFLSWKYDMFKDAFWVNLLQMLSVMMIAFCWYSLFLMFWENDNKEQTMLN